MSRMEDELLTVTQAAGRLGLHRDTLLRQIAKGVLDARRLGSIWVVSGAEVERYRREHRGKHGFASPDHPGHGRRALGNGDGKPQRGDGCRATCPRSPNAAID
jgi:excisionase family DNA binding protein